MPQVEVGVGHLDRLGAECLSKAEQALARQERHLGEVRDRLAAGEALDAQSLVRPGRRAGGGDVPAGP